MPSVALLRHFFYLRNKDGHCSGCANFIAVTGTNAISKAGNKAESFRSKWVLMDAKCSHPRLVMPMEMPTPHDGWFRARLTDPRAEQVLDKMTADLKPDDPKAAKLMGAMIVKEFLAQHVAPLQARSRPLWKLANEKNNLRLRRDALSDEELGTALRLLVGDDQGPTSAAKKKKEGAPTPSAAQQPAAATPPPARKGGDGADASPSRSSSRGPVDGSQEKATSTAKSAPGAPAPSSPVDVSMVKEPPASSSSSVASAQVAAVTLPPPPPISLLARDPSASPDSLEKALSALTRLRDDLQGADHRLELISGWLHSDASVREALG
nr:uncharacterized protein LOC109774906 [Aegilops tauschii subsp. strangulata]